LSKASKILNVDPSILSMVVRNKPQSVSELVCAATCDGFANFAGFRRCFKESKVTLANGANYEELYRSGTCHLPFLKYSSSARRPGKSET
jgi:hypothetical protein